MISETAYYPFGRPRYQQAADGKGSFYTYTGKELDNTGLFYYEARYMDPVIGRFISVDPLYVELGQYNETNSEDDSIYWKLLINPNSFNFYAYVDSNPLSWKDISGLSKSSIVKRIGDFGLKKIKDISRDEAKRLYRKNNTDIMTSKKAAKKFSKNKGRGKPIIEKEEGRTLHAHTGDRKQAHPHKPKNDAKKGSHAFIDTIGAVILFTLELLDPTGLFGGEPLNENEPEIQPAQDGKTYPYIPLNRDGTPMETSQ